MEPLLVVSGVVFSAGAAVRGLRRCARERREHRSTDGYLQWMVADLGSPTMERRRRPAEDHSVQDPAVISADNGRHRVEHALPRSA